MVPLQMHPALDARGPRLVRPPPLHVTDYWIVFIFLLNLKYKMALNKIIT